MASVGEVPLLQSELLPCVSMDLLPTHVCCRAGECVCFCCRAYLEEHVLPAPVERPVYLLGESFGALPSIAVAARRPDLVDRWA